MPSANRMSTLVAVDEDLIEGRYAPLGDDTVSFETFKQDVDPAQVACLVLEPVQGVPLALFRCPGGRVHPPNYGGCHRCPSVVSLAGLWDDPLAVWKRVLLTAYADTSAAITAINEVSQCDSGRGERKRTRVR